MMMPEDVKVVADRVHEILSAQTARVETRAAQDPRGRHHRPMGRADRVRRRQLPSTRSTSGSKATSSSARTRATSLRAISPARSPASDVRIARSIGEVHGAALSYRFTGKLEGDKMSGSLDMGEYLGAKWTATRHAFGRGGDQG